MKAEGEAFITWAHIGSRMGMAIPSPPLLPPQARFGRNKKQTGPASSPDPHRPILGQWGNIDAFRIPADVLL